MQYSFCCSHDPRRLRSQSKLWGWKQPGASETALLKRVLKESHGGLGTDLFLNINHHFPLPPPPWAWACRLGKQLVRCLFPFSSTCHGWWCCCQPARSLSPPWATATPSRQATSRYLFPPLQQHNAVLSLPLHRALWSLPGYWICGGNTECLELGVPGTCWAISVPVDGARVLLGISNRYAHPHAYFFRKLLLSPSSKVLKESKLLQDQSKRSVD